MERSCSRTRTDHGLDERHGAAARANAVKGGSAWASRRGNRDTLAALQGRGVGTDARHGPVGGPPGIGGGKTIFEDGLDELVREVGVRAAVTAALDERGVFVLLIVSALLGLLYGGYFHFVETGPWLSFTQWFHDLPALIILGA